MIQVLKLLAWLAMAVGISAPSWAQPLPTPKISDSMLRAAEVFNVRLLESSYSMRQTGGRVMEGATIAGYEKKPVTEYGKVVDYAIVRFSTNHLKDGYYKARIVLPGPIKKLGKVNVTIELVNSAEEVVHSNPSVVTVFSLVLPDKTKASTPSMEFTSDVHRLTNLSPASFSSVEPMAIHCCPTNGMCGECIGPGCPKK